jgi:phage/plasmid-like protein (TIGR03299 family)
MAHEIDFSNNRANVAFIGKTPWHGLGSKLPAGADLETWRTAAGLNWNVAEVPVEFEYKGERRVFDGRRVLVRDDTGAALSTVSDLYKTVQPSQVLGFFDELVKGAGFELETAGCLRGGNRIWALARVGEEARIIDGDNIRPYLLFATSYDASMATTAQFTSIRVVCNNTLSAAAGDGARAGAAEPKVKIPHFAHFNAAAVREQLGIAISGWDEFLMRTRKMAAAKVDEKLSDAFLLHLFKAAQGQEAQDKVRASKGYKRISALFNGEAIGADMVKGTMWGLVNAVTEYVDHERGLSRSTGLDAAWFGEGAKLKDEAFALAGQLVTAA